MYGWLMTARPVVHVLTDGSGNGGRPRIGSTSTLLSALAASPGSIFGRLSDREIYSELLARNHARFIALVDEIAADLVAHGVELVAGDAVEGFNPSHDVCRYIINAAVRLASRAGERRIACYAFPLDGAPHTCPGGVRDAALRVELDETMLDQKLRAARGYAELHAEVETTLSRFGTAPFRTECLWPGDLDDPYAWNPDQIPFYESYGSRRVASGAYERVVTFRQHVKPLADALWCHSVAG